ncbi:hypothetical protein [Sphaerisporangium perillae]|uniref:hypothetical protein n=1 Tax=Sphaerisporangium perillae TaxID=2935860 RepID=UPI0020100094|nr:hypothetical protein [Sphaerisporangium perillae]
MSHAPCFARINGSRGLVTRPYLRDRPQAEPHLFDTGHFALEDELQPIAPLIASFLTSTSAAGGHQAA